MDDINLDFDGGFTKNIGWKGFHINHKKRTALVIGLIIGVLPQILLFNQWL